MTNVLAPRKVPLFAVSVGTVRLNEPLLVVRYDSTKVSFALFNQFAFSFTDSTNTLLVSSASITYPMTLKSSPAVIEFGTESIRISVLAWTVTLMIVKLPVCLELFTANGSVKSSFTNIRTS